MQTHSSAIEQKIRSESFKTIQDLVDDIRKMKKDFMEETASMALKEKDLILSEEVERLLIKGFESLWRTNGAQTRLFEKQLEERTRYFES